MLLAESFPVEVGYLAVVVGALVGAIVFLFRSLIGSKNDTIAAMDKSHTAALEAKDREIAAKEKELADEVGTKKSWQEITTDAIKSATETNNFYRVRDGKPPLLPVAPVVSESHSPSTEKQRETALISTFRATMESIKLSAGQEPRPEPERAIEKLPEPTKGA